MTATATRSKALAMSRAIRPHVDTLLMATAYAQLERERVDKIERKLLAETVYLIDAKWVKRGCSDERITDPKLSYLMYDDDSTRYHADLKAIHLAAGYEDAEKGYCPALVAEHLQRQAEWALIEAAADFFPGITNDRLLCGTKTEGGMETRQKFLDLLIGMVVNSPGYKSPLPTPAGS